MSRRLNASVVEPAPVSSAERKAFHDLTNHLYAARLCSNALRADPTCRAAQAQVLAMLDETIAGATAKLAELKAALSIEEPQTGRATSRSVASKRSKSTGLVR
jgi:hypothetical protein